MFQSKSFAKAAVALLLSSSTVMAQTDGTLPACTDADVTESNTIIGNFITDLNVCGPAVGGATNLAEAVAACNTTACIDTFKTYTIYDMPTNDCVQYVDANPTNVSSYQQVKSQIMGNALGLENACINYVHSVPSCRGNGEHPEISNRDMETLGNNCYAALMAAGDNSTDGCFDSNCMALGPYLVNSAREADTCSFGYYSNLELAYQGISSAKCVNATAGECTETQMNNYKAALNGSMAGNEAICFEDSFMDALSTAVGSDTCNYMGVTLKNSTWPAMAEQKYNESCAPVWAGECTAAELSSFEAVLAEFIHDNMTYCDDHDWAMKLLNTTEGAGNCTSKGKSLKMSMWADMMGHELCEHGHDCTEAQLQEFVEQSSAAMTGDYATCVAEVAADPETACSTSTVCESVFASLANVTAPDCEIDGMEASETNMTTGITEALAALNTACDAVESSASLMAPTTIVLAGVLVSCMMALF